MRTEYHDFDGAAGTINNPDIFLENYKISLENVKGIKRIDKISLENFFVFSVLSFSGRSRLEPRSSEQHL